MGRKEVVIDLSEVLSFIEGVKGRKGCTGREAAMLIESFVLSHSHTPIEDSVGREHVLKMIDKYIDRTERNMQDAVQRCDYEDSRYYFGQQAIAKEIKDSVRRRGL